MLSVPSNVRLFLATSPADFRKSFDGLAALVESEFGMQPMNGNVFVFINKRANQVRILFWERDGFCLVAKRLESGTFRRTRGDDGAAHVEIDGAQLVMLLQGVDAGSIKRRKRYSPNAKRTSVAKNPRNTAAA